jgi:lysine/ornithine N-monooxygenase
VPLAHGLPTAARSPTSSTYEARTPRLLDPLEPALDARGRLVISADYRLSLPLSVAGSVFV